MQFFPASLQNLSDQFARLPGIGGKTAQRLAFYVLEMPMEEAQQMPFWRPSARCTPAPAARI